MTIATIRAGIQPNTNPKKLNNTNAKIHVAKNAQAPQNIAKQPG